MANRRLRAIQNNLLPSLLAVAGGLLCWTLAGIGWTSSPLWESLLLILAGLLSVGSIGVYRYRRSLLEERRRELRLQRSQLDSLRRQISDETNTFDKRRQKFEDRLMTYHEWMEFPRLDVVGEEMQPHEDRVEEDRLVAERVQQASERIFENFRKDVYSEDGQFQPRLLANDIVDFIGDIARIYQPDSKEPLLETSVEKLLKALNHISLQLLFQVEQLPLNLKEYNLAKAYDQVKKATRIYSAYKSVSPFLPYANYTWQLGRLVLGANPVVAGTFMLSGEIVRRTGQRVSKHYVDRYSLKLTAETIRILANEASMTFDENYRHRDPNWIFGVELTELVYLFPLSRETLQQALGEVGNLPLRNTYDRIFLYRCLAAGRSPQPDSCTRPEVLSLEQRRGIVERLERFFRHHVHGRQKDRVEQWVKTTSDRLGVSVRVLEGEAGVVSEEDYATVYVSLAEFLVATKEYSVEQAEALLARTEISARFQSEQKGVLLEKIREQPPVFFDFPDVDSENPIVDIFIEDLIHVETLHRPRDLQGFWAIREVGDYYRADRKALEERLIKGYEAIFDKEMDPNSPASLNRVLLLALPRVLDTDELPRFIYPRVMPAEEETGKALGVNLPAWTTRKQRWLIGLNERLILLEVREALELDDYERCHIVWSRVRDGKPTEYRRSRSLVNGHITIVDGHWTEDADVTGALCVAQEPIKRFSGYFEPLLNWLKEPGSPLARLTTKA